MLPIKTYVDIGFGLIVIAFLWFVFHEGEKRIEDADARAVLAQEVHNEEVNKRAQSAIQAAEDDYRAKLAAAVVAPVHISVCVPPSSTALSSVAASSSGSVAASDIPAAVGPVRDIGPFTDQLLARADAQIVALQAIVKAQRQQMEQAHAGH